MFLSLDDVPLLVVVMKASAGEMIVPRQKMQAKIIAMTKLDRQNPVEAMILLYKD